MPKRWDCFERTDLFGSRLRYLLLTHMPPAIVANALTGLVSPYAVIEEHDTWMPGGFLGPREACLGEH